MIFQFCIHLMNLILEAFLPPGSGSASVHADSGGLFKCGSVRIRNTAGSNEDIAKIPTDLVCLVPCTLVDSYRYVVMCEGLQQAVDEEEVAPHRLPGCPPPQR